MHYTTEEQTLKKVRPFMKIIEKVQHIRSTKNDIINATYTDKDLLKQYYRFDMGMYVLEIMADDTKDDFVRKLAIRTMIDLLAKTESYKLFSSVFLTRLKQIADNTEEYKELKNIADYILVKVESKELSLKTACNDCALKMVLGI